MRSCTHKSSRGSFTWGFFQITARMSAEKLPKQSLHWRGSNFVAKECAMVPLPTNPLHAPAQFVAISHISCMSFSLCCSEMVGPTIFYQKHNTKSIFDVRWSLYGLLMVSIWLLGWCSDQAGWYADQRRPTITKSAIYSKRRCFRIPRMFHFSKTEAPQGATRHTLVFEDPISME